MSFPDRVKFDPKEKSFIKTSTGERVVLNQLKRYLPKSLSLLFNEILSVLPSDKNIETRVDDILLSKLFDYQLEDVQKAVSEMKGRCILAHEMGCGKSIISISIAKHYGGKVLVICPSYLRSNWKNELLKWKFVSENDIQVIFKTKETLDNDVPVIIISYDLAVRKIDELAKLRFESIIADESQYLKNRNSKRVETLQNYLKTSSNQLLLLSGTPITNCVRDLFVQLNILYPNYFNDYYDFSIRYCDGKRGAFGWDDRGSSNAEELNFALSHLMIRRLKKDILKDLPSKRRMKLYLDVNITSSMKKNMKKLVNLNSKLSKVIDMDNEAPHLKKMFNERMYLISTMFTELSYVKKYAVANYLKGFVDNVGDERFIIFCHHQHFMDYLEKLILEELKLSCIRIDGKTDQTIRQVLVDDFLNNKQVALLSIKAASTGLNLTPVKKMIFAEIIWDLSSLKQAEDRINRIGCDSVCEYFYLIANGTIDNNVFSNVSRKFNVIENVIDNGNDADGFRFA
jgi:SWI/SNF-related matrix-associated actin-dependent regulator of chromatin subfamily A-like protein 1